MSDIKSIDPAKDWLVVGWFTPDYRPLAEKFAANLTEHGAPYHLLAKPSMEAWSTKRKPEIVIEAMCAHPGKTLVLMDVDCIIQGDISDVTRINSDVGIAVRARNMRRGKRWQRWLAVECSSRVAVFRPTEEARAFVQTWADMIARSTVKHDDEHSMAWAFMASPGARFHYIDQRYSGHNIAALPGAIIEHDSAHDDARRAKRGWIKTAIRDFKRLLRKSRANGRSSNEMSALLKATHSHH